MLTDIFQMSEENNTLDDTVFTDNTRRAVEQYQLPVRVILGNPPYSVGQKNANDNNANERYDTLDGRIAATYAAQSEAAPGDVSDMELRQFCQAQPLSAAKQRSGQKLTQASRAMS